MRELQSMMNFLKRSGVFRDKQDALKACAKEIYVTTHIQYEHVKSLQQLLKEDLNIR